MQLNNKQHKFVHGTINNQIRDDSLPAWPKWVDLRFEQSYLTKIIAFDRFLREKTHNNPEGYLIQLWENPGMSADGSDRLGYIKFRFGNMDGYSMAFGGEGHKLRILFSNILFRWPNCRQYNWRSNFRKFHNTKTQKRGFTSGRSK